MQQRESERPLFREAKREAKQKIPSNALETALCWRRGWESNPRYGYPYNGFRVLDSHAVLCRAVANCALWFGIFIATISSCDAWYRAVMRSWFAIWFASSSYTGAGARGREPARLRCRYCADA